MPTRPLDQGRAASHWTRSWPSMASVRSWKPRRAPKEAPLPRMSATAST
jgi:hypothetical protein